MSFYSKTTCLCTEKKVSQEHLITTGRLPVANADGTSWWTHYTACSPTPNTFLEDLRRQQLHEVMVILSLLSLMQMLLP